MVPALPPLLGRTEAFVSGWGVSVMVVLTIVMLVPAVGTERALRATFTREGVRRDRSA